SGQCMADILIGHYDFELSCMSWFLDVRLPFPSDKKEIFQHPETKKKLETVKDYLRKQVQSAVNSMEKEDRATQQREREKLRQNVRNSNKPHDMGTVSELAAKFGKSKSEIRRLKAAGQLHTLRELQ